MKGYRLNQNKEYIAEHDENLADWLIYENPSEEKIIQLQGKYHIPMDFFTDSLDEFEVARHETYEAEEWGTSHLLLMVYPTIKQINKDYTEYETLPLSMIVFEDKVIMVCKKIPTFLKKIYQNQANIAQDLLPNEENVYTPLVLDVLWHITHLYIDYTEEIDQVTSKLEKEVVQTARSEIFSKMISLQKNLVYFVGALERNDKIISQLGEHDIFVDYEFAGELLHDIKIASEQASVTAQEINLKVKSLSQIFTSVISHNLNNIMKFLTSISILLTVPNILSGLWGMNTVLPLEEHPYGFIFLAVLSLAFTLPIYLWLKKKDYL